MPNSLSAEDLASRFHIEVEKYELKNGLRVLLNPDKRAHTSTYILGFHVGARHERPGHTGISHMFEHLMFRGTKKYPDFDDTYANKGVVGVNAYTSQDYTAYFATFPPGQLEFVLDVESDRMTNLILNQELLDKERGAVQEERLLRLDNNPQGFLFNSMFDLMFEKHPYRQPIIGYKEDIADYTLEDLNKWYKTYYSPNNAVLVISGKFSADKAKRLIKKYFGPLPSKTIPKEVKVIEPEQNQPRKRIINKDVQLAQAVMAYKIPGAGHQDFYALEALSDALGSGESSILYKKMVREKKLLKSVSTFAWDSLDYGAFVITYSLSDLSKEEEVKDLILEELNKVMAGGVESQALKKVKNFKMNKMVFGLRRSSYRAHTFLDYELGLNDWTKMYEELNILNNMSSGMVQRAVKKYLQPKQLSYLLLKPEDSEESSFRK